MSYQVCVDASLALKLVLDEEYSVQVRELWRRWIHEGVDIIAPHHLIYEATSAIRNSVHRGSLDAKEGRVAFDVFHAQEILLYHSESLRLRAWEIAETYNRPTAYDAFYVALAEHQSCELWTADKRLFRAVRHDLHWVKWIGDYPTERTTM